MVLLTANLLVIIFRSKTLGAMASSFRGAFCTKRSKAVFEIHSYIKDRVYAENVNGFKYFYKKLGV